MKALTWPGRKSRLDALKDRATQPLTDLLHMVRPPSGPAALAVRLLGSRYKRNGAVIAVAAVGAIMLIDILVTATAPRGHARRNR